jgi:protein KRI1
MQDEILKDTFSSDESLDDEEDSDSDSDVDAKLAEDDVFDVEFLKCYSALKKKDEKIYDKNVRFFENDDSSSSDEGNKKDEEANITNNVGKSAAPKMTLLDLQLKTVEENDDEADNPKIDLNQDVSKSYYEKELEEIKKSIEKVSEDVDDSEDELLVVKDSKSDEAKTKPKSKIESLLDKIVDEDGEDLDHLKQVWANPDNLSKEDKYLRDYILNKRYLPTNVNVGDDNETGGFFSKNLEELSDVDSDEEVTAGETVPTRHSDEKDFDKIARIPRNSTKTIRDMVEKREKKEKRAKKLEKEKKKKKNIANADCEDLIGDLPTRFHYRETEPNDFGLTAEELLMATDEELDRWVNLKECVAYKSQEEELAQKRKFEALRDNIELKRKIFKSVYGDNPTDEAPVEQKSSKKKKTRKRKRNSECDDSLSALDQSENPADTRSEDEKKKERKKKKRRRGLNHKKFAKVGVAPDRLLAYGLSKSKLKKKKLL